MKNNHFNGQTSSPPEGSGEREPSRQEPTQGEPETKRAERLAVNARIKLRAAEERAPERIQKRIDAWMRLGQRLEDEIGFLGAALGPVEYQTLRNIYNRIQGSTETDDTAERRMKAQNTRRFDTDDGLRSAAEEVARQADKIGGLGIIWSRVGRDNHLLEVALGDRIRKETGNRKFVERSGDVAVMYVKIAAGKHRQNSEVQELAKETIAALANIPSFFTNAVDEAITRKELIDKFDANLKRLILPSKQEKKPELVAGGVLLSTPAPAPPGAVNLPFSPQQPLDIINLPFSQQQPLDIINLPFPSQQRQAAGETAPEPQVAVPEPEAAPAAATATAVSGKVEKAPTRPRMTNERRIQIMAKLGSPIDKVKTALGILSDKPDEIVAAIIKAQGDIWEILKADDPQKAQAAKEFADGIWGPKTQKALETVAAYDGVKQKWKDALAAFGGGGRLKAAASLPTAPAEIAPQSLSLNKISSIAYPQDTVPTPELISLAADVRHINKDNAVVIKETGQVVRVLNISAVNNALPEHPPMTLWVEGLDGKGFAIFAASDADDLSEEIRVATPKEKDKFVDEGYRHKLAQYNEKAARDRKAINVEISSASPEAFNKQKHYAKLNAGTIQIVFAGKESGVKVEGTAQGNSPVAVLNRTADSRRVLVMTQTGKTGWIEANNIIQRSLTEKAPHEHMTAVLARVDNLTKQNAPAAAAPSAAPASPKAATAPRVAAQGQAIDTEEPPAT